MRDDLLLGERAVALARLVRQVRGAVEPGAYLLGDGDPRRINRGAVIDRGQPLGKHALRVAPGAAHGFIGRLALAGGRIALAAFVFEAPRILTAAGDIAGRAHYQMLLNPASTATIKAAFSSASDSSIGGFS